MNSSEQIDQYIDKLTDWKKTVMEKFRLLVNSTTPELSEDWKWSVGVWVYNKKSVIAFSTFKDHVKFNFFRGSELLEFSEIFNNGKDSKNQRSIDIFKDDALDESVLKKLVLAALELEKS
jgi:hypothetical protein